MQYTLRNYTKKTFTQRELLDLQDKGVRFVDTFNENLTPWYFDADISTFYAVSESSMQLFLSLVEGTKKEAAEDPTEQFPAFVPLTEMQLKIVGSAYIQWTTDQEFKDFLKDNQERIHNWFIELMKDEREAAEKAVKEAEEARRKAEEENDYVIVDVNATFDYNQRKFAFVQVACGKYKIFQVQDGKIGWNRYFDEEFQYHQKVKISSLFKNQ